MLVVHTFLIQISDATQTYIKERERKNTRTKKLQIFSQVYIMSYFSLSFMFHATKKSIVVISTRGIHANRDFKRKCKS